MAQLAPEPPSGAQRAATGPLAPRVIVRDIRPLDGHLWAVTVRTQRGRLLTLVISKRLATTETVAMAAQVAASLLDRNRLD